MTKRPAIFVILALLATVATATAQQSDSAPPPAEAAKHIPTVRYYRLDFVVRESDQGKVLSQRAYSLGVAAAGIAEGREWWSLRAGTKVPAGSNYVDVGFNLDVRPEDAGGALQLRLKADLSSLSPDVSNVNMPPIRQMRVEEAVLVPINKPTIVFSSEDPSSKHQFQIEVTAVPQK